MAIAFGSINTGLPKDIVQQIMKAERISVDQMQERKGKINEKKGLVVKLEDLVKQLRETLIQNANERSLLEFKVDTDNELIDVSVDKNAVAPGSYRFEVVRLAQRSSAISSGFADKDDSYIGVGFIKYSTLDGGEKELYIDSDNASLSGVARLINAQDIGMKATVINDGSGSDTPYRLIMSLTGSGEGSNAKFPHFYFVDGEDDFYLEKEREAQNAIIKLDGFDVEMPTNKISTLIAGATIDLKKAKPGEEININIVQDTEAIAGKISSLVDNINGILSFIKEQNNLDADSDTSRTLGGDSLLQTLESRIRNRIFQGIKTDYGSFRAGDLGIRFSRNGVLEFNKDTLLSRMNENFHNVIQIFTGRVVNGKNVPGLIQHLGTFASGALQSPNGIISSRKNGFQSNIERIDRRIEQRERTLAKKEQVLKNKFARLESTIARLRGQGAGVAVLGNPAQNPVQQLG